MEGVLEEATSFMWSRFQEHRFFPQLIVLSSVVSFSIWFTSHHLHTTFTLKNNLECIGTVDPFQFEKCTDLCACLPEIIFISSSDSKMPANSLWITDGRYHLPNSTIYFRNTARISFGLLQMASPSGAFCYHCRSPSPGLSVFVCVVVSGVGLGNKAWNLWE